MIRARATLLTVSLAALALTGCNTSADTPADADTTASDTATGPVATDAGTSSVATDPATRTVETAAGPVEIPATVERVATTHNIATQPLVELGIEPVAIGGVGPDELYPDYWAQIADIPQVSQGLEVDVEQLAGFAPDVIFAINAMSDNALDQLSQIAPVVPIGIRGPQRADWQGRAELVADVVNAQDVLADLEEQYAHRAEQIATQYADVLDEHTFNVLDSYEAGTVIPYGPTSMIGNILGPAGATFAPSASSDVVTQIDQSPSQNVSVERLGELTDGTAILYGARSSDLEPSTAQQALLDNEILQRSAAARAGHLYPIGKTTIAGYGDALACLDQFEAALTTLRQ